ncbi:hypothetical protein GCM10023322_39750 [Rugosimonospora acidiphila]|uniref:Beta-lactamase class A catalytic domain-containing protein n=1 Tax=Rugosimonospora acidiphila TaxID=556531 RepID=A0ABP9RYH1_9ACTN
MIIAIVLAGAMVIIYGVYAGPGGQSASASGTTTWGGASPSPSPSPKVDPAIAVRAAVASYLGPSGTHAALALLDQDTGEKVLYQQDQQFDTASIIKVDILATVLYQHQQANQKLSSTEDANAVKMITQSDNDAATALWNDLGGADGLAAANRVFGLTETVPGTDGYWGLTKTTAADQLRLLQVISNPPAANTPTDPPDGAPPASAAGHGTPGPLDAASCDYIFSLMNRVESDQRWGGSRRREQAGDQRVREERLAVLQRRQLQMDRQQRRPDHRARARLAGGGAVQLPPQRAERHRPDPARGRPRRERAALGVLSGEKQDRRVGGGRCLTCYGR